MTITTAQIRGARGILNWSQQDLAQRTGISATSIGSIENGQSTPRANTLTTIQKAFEANGIEFMDNNGIRRRRNEITVLRGAEGFQEFSQILSEIRRNDEREILQAYVDDIKFADLLDKQACSHVEKMEEETVKKFKILQKEGDCYFPAKNYAEYRWISQDQFLSVPFIVYADNLAIMLFEPEPTIIINNFPLVADAYRFQFLSLWDNAILPDASLLEEFKVPDHIIKRHEVFNTDNRYKKAS